MVNASRRQYDPILWCVVPVPGRRAIPVYLVSDEHDAFIAAPNPDGAERAGCYDSTGWRIHIWAGLTLEAFAPILLHELTHAALDTITPEAPFHEENAVTAIGQCGLVETLRAMGWTPPDLPSGWRGLSIHARCLRYGRKRRVRRAS